MKCLLIAILLLASTAFAADTTAAPTAITSITVNGNVATINSTAHGLVVGQGFCLSAQSLCGVAQSGTANQIAGVMSSAPAACASSCGTVKAARTFSIVRTSQLRGSIVAMTIAFWKTTATPAGGNPPATQFSGPTTAEQNALAAGIFVEEVQTILVPSDLFLDVPTLKVVIKDWYSSLQKEFAAGVQPGTYSNIYADLVGWSQ